MKSLEGWSRSKNLDCKESLSQFLERKSEDGQKAAKELDQADEGFHKVRIVIAVLTATQTLWKPLAPSDDASGSGPKLQGVPDSVKASAASSVG